MAITGSMPVGATIVLQKVLGNSEKETPLKRGTAERRLPMTNKQNFCQRCHQVPLTEKNQKYSARNKTASPAASGMPTTKDREEPII